MKIDTSFSFSTRVLITIAALGVALFALQYAADMVNSLLLAWLIVLVASPLLHKLRDKGLPVWLSMMLTLLAILVIFIVFVIILLVGVKSFTDAVPEFSIEIDNLSAAIQQQLEARGLTAGASGAILDFFNPSRLLEFIGSFLAGLIGTVSSAIFIAMLVIFLILEAFNAPEKLAAGIQAGNSYLQRLLNTSAHLRSYIFITTLVALATGTLDTIWFIVMGVPNPLLWGILAFVMSYVPTIGFWLAAIPPALLTLLVSGPAAALIVFLGIVLINGFAENVVKPKYMGEGLNLSPIMIIFSVFFWASVLGPLGAIIGVPMTLLFKELVLEADDRNSWIAALMSSNKPKVGDRETVGDLIGDDSGG